MRLTAVLQFMKVNRATHGTDARRRAFTLVETSVAMFLLGVVSVSLYGAYVSAMNTVRTARQDLRAAEILVDKMDTLRLLTFDDILSATNMPSTFLEYMAPTKNSAAAKRPVFSGTVITDPGPSDVSYSNQLRRITIRVTWNPGNGRNRSREFVTLVSKDGLQNYIQ